MNKCTIPPNITTTLKANITRKSLTEFPALKNYKCECTEI